MCQWHTFSANRNGVWTILHMQRDPDACGRQAAGNVACVHALVTVKSDGRTVIKKAKLKEISKKMLIRLEKSG